MTLNYKYSIGDKVLLTSMPMYRYWATSPFLEREPESALPKEYEINGYGYEVTADGIRQFYRLHAYCDKLITYHNQVSEDILAPYGECHPFSIESDVLSKEGRAIKIGDEVFESVYRRYYGSDTYFPNVSFTFAGHGTVESISYFVEKSYDNKLPNIKVEYRRDFLCTCKNSKGQVVDCQDARKYWYKCHAYPEQICYGVDTTYPEEFAKEITKKENECYLEYNAYDIEQWLTYLGVYDETMAKIAEWKEQRDKARAKNKRKKPEKETKDKKLTDFLASLTEEQKKKLKEML